jgi:hypothetical protein
MRKWTIGEMRKQTQFKPNFGPKIRGAKPIQTQTKPIFFQYLLSGDKFDNLMQYTDAI